jgi:hypothetical protein
MSGDLSTDAGVREALTAISQWGDPGPAPALEQLGLARVRPLAAASRRPAGISVLAVAAVALLIALVAGVLVTRPEPSPVAGADGTWSAMAVGPLSARRDATTLWTGSEVLIFGGRGPGDTPLQDGARYDPATNTWAPMAPLPTGVGGGFVSLAAWTGDDAVYVVNHSPGGEFSWDYDLLAYRPDLDAWRTVVEARFDQAPDDALIALAPVPIEGPEALAMVDGQLVLVGWQSSRGLYGWTVLDVKAGTWDEPHLLPGTADMYAYEKIVQTVDGDLLFALGRSIRGNYDAWGFVIDIDARTAERLDRPGRLANPPAMEQQELHAGRAGRAVVIIGLMTDNHGQTERVAWRLDAGSLEWIDVEPPPDGPVDDWHGASLVTTDGGILLLGGLDMGDGTSGGLHTSGATRLAADLELKRWAELPEPPIDLHRLGMSAVWTGTEVIVWGGATENVGPQRALASDGARYRIS